MRDLDLPAQEKLIDLLNNKLSKVSDKIANPVKSSEAICSTVRRYRHKVVLDLKRLYNQSKSDPDNTSNRLGALTKELAAQNKIRTAHEHTIEEQKKLIDDLMALKKNPAMDRIRQNSMGDSPLPPLSRLRRPDSVRSRGRRPESGVSRYNSPVPDKSPLPMGGNSSMFQLTLGGDEGSGGGSGSVSPAKRGGPARGGPGRPGMNNVNMNMGNGRGGRGGQLGSGGPVFGGGRGRGNGGGMGRGGRAGRGGARGARGYGTIQF